MVQSYRPETITAAGATISFDVSALTDKLLLKADGGAVTLAGNVVVNFTGAGANGQIVEVHWYGGVTLSGSTFTINGVSLSELQAVKKGKLTFQYVDGAVPVWIYLDTPDLNGAGTITGLVIQDASLTLAKFPALERGYQWIGDATNRPAIFDVRRDRHITIGNGSDPVSVPITGAISITNGGVVSITSGVISNTHISPTAGIQVNKLETMTASRPVVTDASGFLSTQSQLTPAQGGLGADQSAANGFTTFVGGVAQIGGLVDYQTFAISFDASTEIGDVKLKLPACTVSSIYVEVTKTVEATNACTITPKDDSGTAFTGGTITLTAGTTIGTGFTSTPTANNVFTSGQIMTLSVAKTTAGGKCLVTLTYTRTALA